VIASSCFLLALAVAYVTFFLAWSPTPRLVTAIIPGGYLAIALNKLLRLPTSGAGFLFLFFASQVLFWFGLILATAWGVLSLHARRGRSESKV